ncbi:hypothetical protein BP6252_00515 [Coleophoma cylindrospora]|uniref:Uncharacterized protein n=1 Tax=Coleophoma cylindrospora TaxID=1849047 RepID=A0A3D8SQ89_9HELO|nr:hypothetical protein BP6252_00515 [Coleophoma cylindrospora]
MGTVLVRSVLLKSHIDTLSLIMAARKQLADGATSAPQKQSAEFENPVTVDYETGADSNTDPLLG